MSALRLPELPGDVRRKLADYEGYLSVINKRINLVSSDTILFIRERHVVHCLALAARAFPAGSTVVDWGTGGGLPALPVAACFPAVTVHAVDAVGKKVEAVRVMARRLGLTNVHPWHGRAEAWPGTAQYSISRATAPLADLWAWHRRVFEAPATPAPDGAWAPGLLCLKGGDLRDEIAGLEAAFPGLTVTLHPLEPLLEAPWFAEKYLVEVRAGDV